LSTTFNIDLLFKEGEVSKMFVVLKNAAAGSDMPNWETWLSSTSLMMVSDGATNARDNGTLVGKIMDVVGVSQESVVNGLVHVIREGAYVLS
jgi:hypothetical protein